MTRLFSALLNRVVALDAKWPLILAVIMVLPSLAAGLFADDYSHAVILQDLAPETILQPDTPTVANLFTFVTEDAARRQQLMAQSVLPWWTVETFHMVFWRPLAELTHWLDYRWLKQPWLMHLHSLFWFALLLWGLKQWFKTILPPQLLAFSLLFFALDTTHGFSLAWLANRNAIMATAFSLLAANQFICLSQGAMLCAKRTALFVIFLLAAFMSGELGICSGVLLLASIIAIPSEVRSVRPMAVLMFIALLVFIAWLWLYQGSDFGARGNLAYYADPVSELRFYLSQLPERFAMAVSILLNPLPLYHIPALQSLNVLLGALLLFASVLYVAVFRQRHNVAALSIMLLAIFPVLSAEIQERNLLFASIGSSILLADCCYRILQTLAHAREQHLNLSTRLLLTPLALLLLAGHLMVSAMVLIPMSYAPKLLASPAESAVRQLPQQQYIVTLGMPVFIAAYLSPISLYQQQAIPKLLLNISSRSQLDLQRLSSETVWRYQLSHADGIFDADDVLMRNEARQPFRIGQTVTVAEHIAITIKALNAAGRVSQIWLDAPQPLNFYRWHSERFSKIDAN